MKYKLKLRATIIVMHILLVVFFGCGVIVVDQTLSKPGTNDGFALAGGIIVLVASLGGIIGVLSSISWDEVDIVDFNKQFQEEIDMRVKEKLNKIITELNRE